MQPTHAIAFELWFAEERSWGRVQRRRKFLQLVQGWINAQVAALYVADVGLSHAAASREVGLREPLGKTSLAQLAS